MQSITGGSVAVAAHKGGKETWEHTQGHAEEHTQKGKKMGADKGEL